MKLFTQVVTSFLLSLVVLSNGFGQDAGARRVEAKAVRNPAPNFGDSIAKYGLPGIVSVGLNVDKAGKVKVIEVVGPAAPCSDPKAAYLEEIRKAALEAASQAEFEPTLKDGKPVEITSFLHYRFNFPTEVSANTSSPVKPSFISAGILNDKAKALPKPFYPAAAHSNRIGGFVGVQVLISESGEVIAAAPMHGAKPLREYAAEAACKAKFPPMLLSGTPVKVHGVLSYYYDPARPRF